MKSFAAMLPLAGLALAQGQCAPGITYTVTSTAKVTVTVQPSSYAAPSEIVTPATQETKPLPTSDAPYYPISNSTTNGPSGTGTNYPTHTPHVPSTFDTYVLPSSDLVSSSTSSKKIKTVYIVPSLVEETPSSSPAAAAPTKAAPAPVESSPVAAPVESAPAAAPVADTSSGATSSAAGSVKGEASFYGGNIAGGACSFSGYTIPSNLFGTAFGGNWDATKCGVCVAVTNAAGKTIKAMVVDQCPECAASKLDLFESAFTQLGTKSAGIIPISYDIVPCGITSPLVLKNKEGTSPYWFSMQVMNSNVAVSKLEVSTDSGKTWKSTTRSAYNFFENPAGYGTSSVDVKVTATNGKSVVVKNVSVAPNAKMTAGSNF
ncbi:barwin-like endoglucanase [Bimuria novae-zelandiae CBS 107.79]|uniref:Barwin-like endoglucanase n=1 Tax=Bimuria novae-zelandiae CBS 107.79 TaxID=1447943 RepID=A0A6A5UUB5_9PLEO|nr:barwin-like endoglucanase [Bimuria novae-zelandiae CBS 107.79]